MATSITKLKEKQKHKKAAQKMYQRILFTKIVPLVGNETTYNTDLKKTGKRLFGKKFLGVFSSNTIPKKIPSGKYLIVNLDEDFEEGSHWIGIAKQKKQYLVYDSFGRKNPFHFARTLRKHG